MMVHALERQTAYQEHERRMLLLLAEREALRSARDVIKLMRMAKEESARKADASSFRIDEATPEGPPRTEFFGDGSHPASACEETENVGPRRRLRFVSPEGGGEGAQAHKGAETRDGGEGAKRSKASIGCGQILGIGLTGAIMTCVLLSAAIYLLLGMGEAGPGGTFT
jgi:hypothetical protein